MPDPWQILGLEPGTPWSEVRARWRALCKELHPDHNGDPAAGARLAAVNAAYESLGEHDRREVPAAPAMFPDAVFDALLEAASDIGDVTDAAAPAWVEMRLDGGWCRASLDGRMLTVDTLRLDADAVCDRLVTGMARYLGRR